MPAVVIPFTLFSAGVEKSLADWGLDDLQFSDNDLAAATVEFTALGRAVDAADLFPYGARVLIFQNRSFDGASFSGGVCWFDGRVEPWTREGEPGAENCLGRLVNAWWYFDRLQFKMQFFRTDSAGHTVTYTTNRVVLGIAPNPLGAGWISLNTGGQIAAAVNWAAGQGAPVALGNVAPWAPVVTDFQKCIKVSQVIEKMWHIESDFIVVWDYSTVGTDPAHPGVPTVHFKKCSAANCDPLASPDGLVLAPLTISLDDGGWLTKIKIRPRPDWIKSYVAINYDQITTIGSDEYLGIGLDQWPPVLPSDTESLFRGVDLYFDLAGAKIAVTTEQGNLTSAPFNITDVNQWKVWKPELTAPTVSSVVIVTAGTTPAAAALHPAPSLVTREVDATGAAVPYNSANAFELLDGAYTDWMADATLMAGAGLPAISSQKVKVTAWAFITYANGTKIYKQITKEFTAISFNTGNVALTPSVSAQNVTSYAEAQPAGLAEIMFNAFRSLAVEGSFSTLETELGATRPQITRANCLNFTSAALLPHAGDGTILDWSAVNAPVRRVSGSAVKGTATVEFGAPLHLSANELVDIVRASRVRVPSVNLAFLFGGALAVGGGRIKHPRKSAGHAAEHGADEPQIHVVAAPDTLDATRTNVITADGTTGGLNVAQVATAAPAVPLVTGLIMPQYSGTGSPGPATLA